MQRVSRFAEVPTIQLAGNGSEAIRFCSVLTFTTGPLKYTYAGIETVSGPDWNTLLNNQ